MAVTSTLPQPSPKPSDAPAPRFRGVAVCMGSVLLAGLIAAVLFESLEATSFHTDLVLRVQGQSSNQAVLDANANPHVDGAVVERGTMSKSATPAPGQPRVAVLFFGLTRSLRFVHDNIKEHLLDRLPPHDVFLHTYNLMEVFNPRAGEDHVKLDQDEYKLLKPVVYEIENQDLVDKTLPFEQVAARGNAFARKEDVRENPAGNITLLNVLRQFNSLAHVHNLMTLHEARMGFQYDWVVVSRPDIRFLNNFTWAETHDLGPKEFIVPEFGKNTGLNDRFMVGRRDAARAYCHRRDYVRCQQSPLHSERLLFSTMRKEGFKAVFSPVVFNRMRANGMEKKYRRLRSGAPAAALHDEMPEYWEEVDDWRQP